MRSFEKVKGKAALLLATTLLGLGATACGGGSSSSEQTSGSKVESIDKVAAFFGQVALAHRSDAVILPDRTVRGGHIFRFQTSVNIEGGRRTDIVSVSMAPDSGNGNLNGREVYSVSDEHRSCPATQTNGCPTWQEADVMTNRSFILQPNQPHNANGDWSFSIHGNTLSGSTTSQSSCSEINGAIAEMNFDMNSVLTQAAS